MRQALTNQTERL